MKKEEVIKELTETGQLPMELWGWDADYGGRQVKVDFRYLTRVLKRLVSLRQKASKHLAQADIPDTINYILEGIPDKVIKEIIN